MIAAADGKNGREREKRPVRRPIELPKEWGITALSVWATCFVSGMMEESPERRTPIDGNMATQVYDSNKETRKC